MAKSKLPAKLYVTGKHQYFDKNDPNAVRPAPLGFLNAYEPGKVAFEKKRKTQEDWAYHDHSIVSYKLELHGPEWWMIGVKRGAWAGNGIGYHQIPFSQLADPQPQIWDNTPTDHFMVVKSVSRYSTNNKLWRIEDPRGFEFEISTACLETIIDEAGIAKGGEIMAKCAWMSNKNLVVVP